MDVVRRYRRAILAVLAILSLTAMTWGFLRRVGVDPLAALRPETEQR